MKRTSIPFKETGQFSGLVDDYLFGNPELKPFYRFTPDLEGLTEKLDQRRKSTVNRELLHVRILQQYGRLPIQHDQVLRNINLLSEQNTFTVTTGHQLNILTGPLYFIYKIATTIRLAGELTRLHPDCNFIPLYWMASEDHDFDEIRSVRVFGNTINWSSDHKGAVGKFSTIGMEKILEEVSAILGEQLSIPDVFFKAYTQNANLADATRQLVNDLFGKYGLVVIDGDDRELKRTFIPEMKEELMKMVSSSSVEITNREFSKRYKVQVSPRDINLFYMIDGLRERIINEANDVYIVNNTNLKFSKDELLAELESHPERFSPNVIMRPLYQEKILPNLAYIGGPGELNYWLQLASTFDAFQIPFPVLVLRNCFLLLNSSVRKKMEKLNLNTDDLFSSVDFLTLKVLESSSDLHVGTEIQSGAIQKSFDELNRTYSQLDSTLAASVEAERQKVLNSLKSLEEKARRLLKKKNETVVGQVKTLKEQLMPGGSLQERTDNILSYSNGDPEKFIDFILSNTDPFEKDFVILDLP
jgi:bacillithiol biosynthesis cysteine-adding enzyme BshC